MHYRAVVTLVAGAALVAALAFAIAHVITNSRQFVLYQEQQRARGSEPRLRETILFMFIKAAFTFAEIAIIVLVVTQIMGART